MDICNNDYNDKIKVTKKADTYSKDENNFIFIIDTYRQIFNTNF